LWYYNTALQPDGKIIVLCGGGPNELFYESLIIARFNSNGTLDKEFAEGGIKYIPIQPIVYVRGEGNSVIIQPDGKIIIAATSGLDFIVMRLNSDGSFDDSFGQNGTTTTDFTGFGETSRDKVLGIFLRPDGRILVYGDSDVATLPYGMHYRPALAQYNSDGSLDVSFGVNGIQKLRFASSQAIMSDGVIVRPNGKILMSSYFTWETQQGLQTIYTYYPGFVQFNENGTLDTNFANNGYRIMRDLNRYYLPLQEEKFLAVNAPYNDGVSNTYAIRFLRYGQNLSVDLGFSIVGHALIAGAISDFRLQSDGKIICSTYPNNYPNIPYIHRATVYRFNPDGSVDTSFGTNGASIFDLDGSNFVGSSIKKTFIQPDGKIIVAGNFNSFADSPVAYRNKGIAIMRLNSQNTKVGF
jgi:uncharacterized delta-60 repeat protein